MKLRIVKRSDFEAGLFFLAAGVGIVLLSSGYQIGTTSRMGPGFFPMMLGSILAAIGAVLVGRGLLLSGRGDDTPAIDWRSAVVVLGSVAVFGLLLRMAGLLLAIVALVLIASLAAEDSRFKWSLLLAVALALFCYLIFVAGLGLPLPIMPRAI